MEREPLQPREHHPVRAQVTRYRERLGALVFHVDAWMVLQVLPDAGKIDRHGDTVAAQLVGGTNPGQHQKLWRVEGPSSQDDLAGRSHLPLHPALRVADAVGTVALEPNPVHLRSEL